MAKGNTIIVSAVPDGEFQEGIIGDASLPGTVMQLKAATEPVSGRHTWVRAAPLVDGQRLLIAILLADDLQGQLTTTAYTPGRRGFLYVPQDGEEFNMLVGDNSQGATQTFAIADYLSVGGPGKLGSLIPAPSALITPSASVPFQVLETLTAVVVPYLAWVKYTGR